ncbi:Gfo/Idh/MocA family oxidoreductase [Candidatus Sumerlaeota bacterium]|nr:Gfo/Idh/MocA family oxidoreductase [Candidatus Sumerlaeota bacterium]
MTHDRGNQANRRAGGAKQEEVGRARRCPRRRFLKQSLIGAAAIGAARRSTAPAPFARVRGANDDIRIAVVGIGSTIKIGGKGKQDIRDWLKTPGVRVVALCDVDRAHLDPEVKKFTDRNEKVDAYIDVRKLLEDKNIDAVSITTPNHWHALGAVWACQAGKDVFVQKPASHNIFEGRKMVEAARKYGRIVLSTAGPRGRTGLGEAFEYARQGKLGKMLCVHGLNYRPRMTIGKVAGPQPIPKTIDYDLWSGPASLMPVVREFLHYDWHWFWHYGNGDLGNMGIHNMDGCRWAVGQDTLPRRVISLGGRFGYEDDGETPNTQIIFLDYEPAPIIFEVRGLPKNKSYLQQTWEKRAKETMDSYRDIQIGIVVQCENGYLVGNKAYDKQGKLIQEFQPTNNDLMTNFVTAARSRKSSDLQSDILQGHLSAALVHMGNISFRVGRESPSEQIREAVQGEKDLLDAFERLQAHLDANEIDLKKTPVRLGAWLTMDPANERFMGPFSEQANKLLSRDYRKPFVVPENV